MTLGPQPPGEILEGSEAHLDTKNVELLRFLDENGTCGCSG
jgi:hypothetical protein